MAPDKVNVNYDESLSNCTYCLIKSVSTTCIDWRGCNIFIRYIRKGMLTSLCKNKPVTLRLPHYSGAAFPVAYIHHLVPRGALSAAA